MDTSLTDETAGLHDSLIRQFALEQIVAQGWVARLQSHANACASCLLEQCHLLGCDQIGPHIAKERQTDLLGKPLGQLPQPILVDNEQIIKKNHKLHRVALAHRFDFFDHFVHAHLAEALGLAPVNLGQGMVETVGAIVGTTPTGDKVLDTALPSKPVHCKEEIPIGKRQDIQIVFGRADGVALHIAIVLEPPILNGSQGTIGLYRFHQVEDGPLPFAHTDPIYTWLLDKLGEIGWMRSTKDRYHIHCILDLQVQVAVVGLRSGVDAIAHNTRQPLACHSYWIFLAGYGQPYLVTSLPQHAGQVQQAQGFVIYLFLHEKHAHRSIPILNVQ